MAAAGTPTAPAGSRRNATGPFEVGGKASAERIKGATLKVYPGAPHGITDTHKEQLSADLLEFLKTFDECAEPAPCGSPGRR